MLILIYKVSFEVEFGTIVSYAVVMVKLTM